MLKIKNLFWILLLLLICFAQFFKPEKNEGNYTSVEVFLQDTKPSKEVEVILKEACFNCHTNHTNYPWYNSITPINYWLAKDINKAKKQFNMSFWQGNSVAVKSLKFKKIVEVVKTKKEPIHKALKLNKKQRHAVVEWANFVRLKYSMQTLPE